MTLCKFQVSSEAGVSQNAGQTEQGDTDPMDNIDSQILDEHFTMVCYLTYFILVFYSVLLNDKHN